MIHKARPALRDAHAALECTYKATESRPQLDEMGADVNHNLHCSISLRLEATATSFQDPRRTRRGTKGPFPLEREGDHDTSKTTPAEFSGPNTEGCSRCLFHVCTCACLIFYSVSTFPDRIDSRTMIWPQGDAPTLPSLTPLESNGLNRPEALPLKVSSASLNHRFCQKLLL